MMKDELSDLQTALLLKIHQTSLESNEPIFSSELLADPLDRESVYQAILELASRGLLTHGDPELTAADQTIRQIPGIRLTR